MDWLIGLIPPACGVSATKGLPIPPLMDQAGHLTSLSIHETCTATRASP